MHEDHHPEALPSPPSPEVDDLEQRLVGGPVVQFLLVHVGQQGVDVPADEARQDDAVEDAVPDEFGRLLLDRTQQVDPVSRGIERRERAVLDGVEGLADVVVQVVLVDGEDDEVRLEGEGLEPGGEELVGAVRSVALDAGVDHVDGAILVPVDRLELVRERLIVVHAVPEDHGIAEDDDPLLERIACADLAVAQSVAVRRDVLDELLGFRDALLAGLERVDQLLVELEDLSHLPDLEDGLEERREEELDRDQRDQHGADGEADLPGGRSPASPEVVMHLGSAP